MRNELSPMFLCVCTNCLESGPSAGAGIDCGGVSAGKADLPGRELPTTLALVLSLAPWERVCTQSAVA